MRKQHNINPKFRGFNVAQKARILLLCTITIVGNSPVANPAFNDFPKFASVLADRYGPSAIKRGNDLRQKLITLGTAPVVGQLQGVNQFFNQRVTWQSDVAIYGVSDFWATPAETLGKGKGDCEDFTIAKYVSLRHLGIPSEQLRLTYVRLQRPAGRSQAHMVLAWYKEPGATPLILDNANPRVLPANERRDLKPVFSFNSDALWVGESSQTTDVAPSSRLSQWRQMINRAQAEGIKL